MIWQRQSYEPKHIYEVFVKYKNNPQIRAHPLKLAKEANVSSKTIQTWRNNYNWEERAEAYDRYMEEEEFNRRQALLTEKCHRLNEQLINDMELLNVVPSILAKKLKNGGIEQLENLEIIDLFRISSNHMEIKAKIGKVFKEYLSLIPEGRKILEQEDKSEKITIVLNPVNSSPTAIDINTETKKTKEIEHKEDE